MACCRTRSARRRRRALSFRWQQSQSVNIMAYYYKHPDLNLPHGNCMIWRYLDFWKLESMLEKGAIYFSRADKQSDKLEGEYPPNMINELQWRFGRLKSDDGKYYTFLEWHKQKEIPSRLLSSWNISSHESKKRWSEYTKNTQSVAIRSTIGRLKKCFSVESSKGPVVWIGQIRYGDEENKLPNSYHKWNVNYYLYPFFGKKEEYRWEKEIRATVNLSQKNQRNSNCGSTGCFIKANINVLFSSIWLHPRADNDFYQKVKRLLDSSSYGKTPIFQSC